MKKIYSTILAVSAFAFGAFAQCSADPSTLEGTFKPGYNNATCADRNVAYSQTVSFHIPAQVTNPVTATVDSVRFVSVNNLPCDLTATFSRSSGLYAAHEIGCMQISGTTADVAGNYRLIINMDAKVNQGGGSSTWVTGVTADLAGLIYWVRVKETASSCVAITDTFSRTPSSPCPALGIQEVASISAASIHPNPFSNSAVLSFNAGKSSVERMRIINIVGKEISSSMIDIKQGENEIELNRGNLSEGVYFVTIGTGRNAITRKMIIQN